MGGSIIRERFAEKWITYILAFITHPKMTEEELRTHLDYSGYLKKEIDYAMMKLAKEQLEKK